MSSRWRIGLQLHIDNLVVVVSGLKEGLQKSVADVLGVGMR